MAAPQIRFAYLFWFSWMFGFAGLHRFYLGRPVSGILHLITWGYFGIGTLYDAVVMPQLVRTARLERRLDDILDGDVGGGMVGGSAPGARPINQSAGGGHSPERGRSGPVNGRGRRSLEHAILNLAEERHGVVTPARAALHASTSADRARVRLDRLVEQGFAQIRVSQDGAVVYVFPEFLDDQGRQELDGMI